MQGFWDNCATVNSMNKAAINSPNPRSSTLERSPTLTLTSEFVSDATNKAKCHHPPAPPFRTQSVSQTVMVVTQSDGIFWAKANSIQPNL